MAAFVGYGVVALVALAPLLHRFYMDRFWIHGSGKVVRLDGGINFNPGPGGGMWVWTPVIEYPAGGQPLELQHFLLAALQRQIEICGRRRGEHPL